jgi:uncharacterized protein with HEPN domain
MAAGKDERSFLADEKLMRATCMTLINIGELVKNLSEECRLAHVQIPWKDMAGLRDINGARLLHFENVGHLDICI